MAALGSNGKFENLLKDIWADTHVSLIKAFDLIRLGGGSTLG